MQTMTRNQAALLLIVAGILKDDLGLDDARSQTLTKAIEDVAFELAALGMKAPPGPSEATR